MFSLVLPAGGSLHRQFCPPRQRHRDPRTEREVFMAYQEFPSENDPSIRASISAETGTFVAIRALDPDPQSPGPQDEPLGPTPIPAQEPYPRCSHGLVLCFDRRDAGPGRRRRQSPASELDRSSRSQSCGPIRVHCGAASIADQGVPSPVPLFLGGTTDCSARQPPKVD